MSKKPTKYTADVLVTVTVEFYDIDEDMDLTDQAIETAQEQVKTDLDASFELVGKITLVA